MANRQSIKNHTKLLFKPNKRHSQTEQYQDKLLNHLSIVPIFYLSDYRYGGCTTFTAHLICLLQKKHVFYLTQDFEKEKGNFGYGIRYLKKPLQFQDNAKKVFIAEMYRNFQRIPKLENKDATIVGLNIEDRATQKHRHDVKGK